MVNRNPNDPWGQVGEPGWPPEPDHPQHGPGYAQQGGYGQQGGYRQPGGYGQQPPPGYGHNMPPAHLQPGYGQPGHLGGGPPQRPPRPPMPPMRRQPPRRTSGGVIAARILSGMLALALVLGSGIAWSAVGGTPKNASDATDEAGNVGVADTDGDGNPLPAGGINILIVGTDSRSDAAGNPLPKKQLKEAGLTWTGGGTLTDTMIIVHVPADGSKATAVSLPRDTWIDDSVANAPGVVGPYAEGGQGPYRANKLNSFYGTAKTYERQYLVSQGESDEAKLERKSSEAGRTMLIKVLQQLTGVKIDHYAEINLIGFYYLSQAIGGVPVCLVAATKDPLSRADFPAGQFEVSGHDALAFVRQRHGLPRGDLDRVRRQQAFLAGAADKILSLGTLTSPKKLSDLVAAADSSLVLDKNFDLLSFGQQMIALSSGNINFTTIPTHGDVPGIGTSALAVDVAEVRQLFADLMTDRAPTSAFDPSSVTVDVQNGTDTGGVAAKVGETVAQAGFERGQLSDYPGVTPKNQVATTQVRYGPGGKSAAKRVARAIKVGDLVRDDTVGDGHVLVVVGTDFLASPGGTPKPPSSEALPAGSINAGSVPCVN